MSNELNLDDTCYGAGGCDIVFFFSSRRRHTRFDCDWSSDVCSSDLNQILRAVPYDRWEQLEAEIPAWEAILDHNPSLSIFSTPEWLGSWWKAFGSKDRKSVV